MSEAFTGEIRLFAGARIPANWLPCDGRLLAITQYEMLYALIGATYGGDGVTTFAIPDLRGRLVMGFGTGPGRTPRTILGQKLGTEIVQIAPETMPTHSHSFNASSSTATSNSPQSNPGNMAFATPPASSAFQLFTSDTKGPAIAFAKNVVGTTPPGGAHSNMMPSLALCYMICCRGLFPTGVGGRGLLVASLDPPAGPPSSGTANPIEATINGNDFGENPQVWFGENQATVISSGSTQIKVAVPPGHGVVPVYVICNGQTSPATTGSYYTYSPSVFSLQPAVGPSRGNVSIRIRGTGLCAATAVSFGGTTVSGENMTVVDDRTIEAIVPPQPPGTPNIISVTVTTPAGTTIPGAESTFTYRAFVLALSPDTGPAAGGTEVTLSGGNFTVASKVYFGALEVTPVTLVDSATLTVTAPPGTGTVEVSVRKAHAEAVIDAPVFHYEPQVAAVAPRSGPPGTIVTVTGDNFTEDATVQFGDLTVSPNAPVQPSVLTVAAPQSTGVVPVSVTTAGGTSTLDRDLTFSYLPIIAALEPASGTVSGGTKVTISGENFGSNPTVYFGSQQVVPVSSSPLQIVVASPPADGAATVVVGVTAEGGASPATDAALFTYGLAVTNVIPNTGTPLGSTQVAITGSGFTADAVVSFGDVKATGVVVVSDTAITCDAPPGAGFVNVTVTIGQVTSPTTDRTQFSYMPYVKSVTPATGSRAGGTTVSIAGHAFSQNASVQFGNTPATDVTVLSQNLLTATVPPGEGKVPVTVTTPAGVSPPTRQARFGYVPGIYSIDPAFGPAGGESTVWITGQGLDGTSEILFGGASTTPIKSSSGANSLRCRVPAGVGQVYVTVVTPAGTTGKAQSALFTYGPAVISLSSPGQSDQNSHELSLIGTGFTGATEVSFLGGEACGDVAAPTVISDTSLTVMTPCNLFGSVCVQVAGPFGHSPPTIFYNYPPLITDVVASTGGGGTKIAISGYGFVTRPQQVHNEVVLTAGGTSYTLAAELSRGTPQSLTCHVPYGVSGTVGIVVRNESWGTSNTFNLTLT